MFELLLRFFGVGAGPKASIAWVRKSDSKAAIVFVHGFTGSGATTWTGLLPGIEAQGSLSGWDICTISYSTSRNLDISGIWAADADLKTLSKRLATDLLAAGFASYDTLVLVAHSMGGLVVQRALLDFPGLVERTRCVILLGTPSNGLEKARVAGESLEASAPGHGLGRRFRHGAARGLESDVRGSSRLSLFLRSPARGTSSSRPNPRWSHSRKSSRRSSRAIMCRCLRRRRATTISSRSSVGASATRRLATSATRRCA